EGRDTGEIEDLLRASGLPVEGVQAHIRDFFITREGPAITGVIGLEQYGEDGLLRSLAVREPDRSKGIGSRLCLRLIDEARTRGIRRLVLLTTTAGEYFSVRGFRIIDRSSIAGGLRDSAEFRGACPASATCMERLL
ncbi:MAG TPA: arsenic resistance N-acetyltransferase ArsN2, partial [Bacteroidota bacterium]|nr:arsenic resistance N-acetyltransferase ArsN2 [Bacteroidota bacterium]